MKIFWVAFVLFALLVTGTVFNYQYINRVANEMAAELASLPDVGARGASQRATALLLRWESQADVVNLTVSFPIVDRVSEQATALVAAAECGDLYGYRNARALLADAIEDMRRLERFSIGNIF